MCLMSRRHGNGSHPGPSPTISMSAPFPEAAPSVSVNFYGLPMEEHAGCLAEVYAFIKDAVPAALQCMETRHTFFVPRRSHHALTRLHRSPRLMSASSVTMRSAS